MIEKPSIPTSLLVGVLLGFKARHTVGWGSAGDHYGTFLDSILETLNRNYL